MSTRNCDVGVQRSAGSEYLRRVHTISVALVIACNVILVICPEMCLGQQPPADGSFLLVCTFYGESNQGGSAWNRQQSCQLPPDFPLDDAYRQQTAFFSGGGASSNIRDGQIPSGIHLDISGGHYWSVNQPMSLAPEAADGRRTFTIETYCGPAGAPGPGCNVKVNVFARKRQTWSSGQAFFGWSSIYARNKESIVLLRVESEGQTPNYGSGIVLDTSGTVLTAKHLLPDSNSLRNRAFLITGLLDWERPTVDFSKASKLSIEYVSKQADFAVLKFSHPPSIASPIFFESALQPAEPILILGYPGGGNLSAMTGVASGDAGGGKFGINTPLGEGSSGGPVFSPTGGLVGIVVLGPRSADPGKLAFFLTSAAILGELPAPSGTSLWPNLPKSKSDHMDTLQVASAPSSPERLDFRYAVHFSKGEDQKVACCTYRFEAQRGMRIVRARFVPRSTSASSGGVETAISPSGDSVTLRLPRSKGESDKTFMGYLWTRQTAGPK
jgi:Trypsin-like peptidase domain